MYTTLVQLSEPLVSVDFSDLIPVDNFVCSTALSTFHISPLTLPLFRVISLNVQSRNQYQFSVATCFQDLQ